MSAPLETKPSMLQISGTLRLRYQKTGDEPPLVLMHTIRTQLEYFRIWHLPLPNRIRSTPSIFPDMAVRRSIPMRTWMSRISDKAL